jgi:hypothetical protein
MPPRRPREKTVMKKPSTNPIGGGSGFVINHMADCWIAIGEAEHHGGILLYNKLTGTYHAWVCEQITTFPKLAQAPYKNTDDSPVDENHNLKADFVMLLALRKRFKEHVPGSQFVAWSWRKRAFLQRRSEIEAKTGKPLSKNNWAHCMRIANSEELFEEYAAKWLANIVCDVRASETLGRFSKWLEKAEDIENEELPAHYSKFFAAVESAAMEARGVPEKKAVQAIYEKGMSANQLGKGHGFRDVMRQLKFEWLPAGKRGRAQHPKKSGIR